MARAVARQLSFKFSTYFDPVQFGVGLPGGLEVVVHSLRAWLEVEPSFGVLQLDLQNAFNSVSRATVLSEVEPS